MTGTSTSADRPSPLERLTRTLTLRRADWLASGAALDRGDAWAIGQFLWLAPAICGVIFFGIWPSKDGLVERTVMAGFAGFLCFRYPWAATLVRGYVSRDGIDVAGARRYGFAHARAQLRALRWLVLFGAALLLGSLALFALPTVLEWILWVLERVLGPSGDVS